MRRVVVHQLRRGGRLSRYAHFNSALRQAERFNQIKDRDKLHREVDLYLWDLLRYSDARCIHVLRLLLINGKMCVSPNRLTRYEEFHNRCGRYVVSDGNHKPSHRADIVDYGSKMDHILRRKKPPHTGAAVSYRRQTRADSGLSSETYDSIMQGVSEALSRLQFDPVRDFSENTVGLVDSLWRIGQLNKKDSPK